jgi:hypothetical protein
VSDRDFGRQQPYADWQRQTRSFGQQQSIQEWHQQMEPPSQQERQSSGLGRFLLGVILGGIFFGGE